MSDTATPNLSRAHSHAHSHGSPWQRYGWLMSVVWLVFLVFPARALLESTAPLIAVALGWVSLGIFTLAYLIGFKFGMRLGWRQKSHLVYRLFGLAALCAALTIPSIGWGAASLLPFLMAYAAYAINTVWHWITSSFSIAVVALEAVVAISSGEQPAWVLMAVVALMTAVNTLNTWLIDRTVQTEELRMHLVTSEERESIARDVHDLLGHTLTVVKLKSELAIRLIDKDHGAARAELEEISRLTGEAIAGVRGTVTGLRSQGLAEQLRISRSALDSAGIDVRVRGEVTVLSPAQSITASWVLREATTNVLRHARAQHVLVTFEPGTMSVRDDGIGFDMTQVTRGTGLESMAERATAAGANLRVGPTDSGAGAGTEVRLTW